MKYRYGDNWERYSIMEGEVWIDIATGSKMAVWDLMRGLPSWMAEAQMVYCDPPWSMGNVNAFITKAERKNYIGRFDDFYAVFFRGILEIGPTVCYVEIGRQHREDFVRELRAMFPVVQEWPITYYGKNHCFLLRGGSESQLFDFSGMDDVRTPLAAIEHEPAAVVADPCTGQGLTAVAAYLLGRRFIGTELNCRRLAVAIHRVNKAGGNYARAIS
jgi:hypothetical protein